jgi:hypothetical protein
VIVFPGTKFPTTLPGLSKSPPPKNPCPDPEIGRTRVRASLTLLNGSEELTSRAASVLLELALAAGTFPGFRQLHGPPGVDAPTGVIAGATHLVPPAAGQKSLCPAACESQPQSVQRPASRGKQRRR